MEIINAHAYDISIDNVVIKDAKPHQEIQLWCLNKESKPILCRVVDYKFTFYGVLPKKNTLNWKVRENITTLYFLMKKKIEEKAHDFDFEIKLEWRYSFYYYSEKLDPFIHIVCDRKEDAFTIVNLCKKIYFPGSREPIIIEYVEHDIQTFNKMFSERNLSISDKFFCEGKKIIKEKYKISTIDEYLIDYTSLEKDESDWVSKPMVLSFDIESYSHRHRAFPESLRPQDVVFSISLCFQKFTETETRRNYVIIMYDCVPIDNDISTDIIVVNTEIEVFQEFFRLIRKYDPEVIIGYNIFGFDYNYIENRLDMMDEFQEVEGGEPWGNISRLINTPAEMKQINWNSSAYGDVSLKYINCPGRISVDLLPYIKRDHKLSMYTLNDVSKYFLGSSKEDMKAITMFEIYQEISEFYMENGLSIDEPKTIKIRSDRIERKDHTLKNKEHIDKSWSYDKIKQTLEENNYLVAKYNIQDSILVMQLFDKLSVWINIIEMSNVVRITPQEVFTRGQGIRVMAQLYDTASKKKIVLTKRIKDPIFSAGGKVEDPIPGKWDNVICFDFNSLYPSIMIAYNICHTTLIRKIENFDKDKYNHFHIEQEEPKDFKIEKDKDFDFGSYIEAPEAGTNDSSSEEEAEEVKKKKKKKDTETVHKEYEIGFVKPEVKKGLLPEILEKLLSDRGRAKKIKKTFDGNVNKLSPYIKNQDFKIEDLTEEVKKLILYTPEDTIEVVRKKLLDSFKNFSVQTNIYDCRQLVLKISANSVYGFTGAQINGQRPLIEGSMSVTAKGRDLITSAGLFFEKNFGATVVYGDTDSTMVHVDGTTPENHYDLAIKMQNEINGYPAEYDKDGNLIKEGKESVFPKPLNLEFEKAMKAIFMKKKMYAYKSYNEDGTLEKEKGTDRDVIYYKGILPARRDNNKWMRDYYIKLLEDFFHDVDIVYSLNILRECIIDAIELKYDLKTMASYMSIVSKMGSNYAMESNCLNMFGKMMRKIDKPIEPGDRFPYVMVLGEKGMKKGEIMRTNESFVESWEISGVKYGEKIPENYVVPESAFYPKEIDSKKYIELFGKKLDSLFKYNYLKELKKYKDKIIYYPEKRTRLHPINFEKPMSFFCKILQDYEEEIQEKGMKSMIPIINKIFNKIIKRIKKIDRNEY